MIKERISKLRAKMMENNVQALLFQQVISMKQNMFAITLHVVNICLALQEVQEF